jgi:hypothetical protein
MSMIPHCLVNRLTWRLGCQPYAPAALYPQKALLVLVSVSGWVDLRTTARLDGLVELRKKSSYLIGTRTHDLQTCSTAPQPSTLPSTPIALICRIFSNLIRTSFLPPCSVRTARTPALSFGKTPALDRESIPHSILIRICSFSPLQL